MVDDLPVAAMLLIEDVDCAFKDCRNTTGAYGRHLERAAQCTGRSELA